MRLVFPAGFGLGLGLAPSPFIIHQNDERAALPALVRRRFLGEREILQPLSNPEGFSGGTKQKKRKQRITKMSFKNSKTK